MKKAIILLPLFIICIMFISCDNTTQNADSIETEIATVSTTAVSTEIPQEDEYINILVHSYSLEEVGLKLNIPDDKIPKSPYILKLFKEKGLNQEEYENYSFLAIDQLPRNEYRENGSTRIYVDTYPEPYSINGAHVVEYVAFKYSDLFFSKDGKHYPEIDSKLYKISDSLGKEDVYVTAKELKQHFKVYSDGDIIVCDISKISLYGNIAEGRVYDGYDIKDYMEDEKKHAQREDMDFQWLYDFVDYLHENISDIIVKA